jgi:predicted O-methyltransferase YrrM
MNKPDSNLRGRLRLLRTALTRRFIWNEVADMARGYGMDYTDVRGSLGPLDLFARLESPSLPPSPGGLGLAADYTPPGAPGHFHSEPSVSRFLYQLACMLPARTIIELGCFTGWSTAHLAQAARTHGGSVWAVDPSADYLAAAQSNLRRHGLEDRVEWLEGFSLEPTVMRNLPRNADLIFLDTSHSHPETRDEVLAYTPHLSPAGCLVLHDAISAPGVRRSLDELSGHYAIHRFGTEHGHGVAVLFPLPR